MRVLVVAYACEPARGGEPEVGWQMAINLAAHADVTIVTRCNNRPVIESNADVAAMGLEFLYVDSPSWQRFYKRGNRGVYVYQLHWQLLALRASERVHRRDPFDLVHQVTFSGAWYPSLFMFLGPPFVWGPLATSVPLPPSLAATLLSKREQRLNRMRRWLNGPFARWNPLVKLGRDRAVALPVVNSMVATSMAPRHRSKVLVLPAVGTDSVPTKGLPSGDSERLRVVMLGRLIGLKAAPLALMAIARVQAERRPTLRIIGEGPARRTLGALVTTLGIEDHVEFVGVLSHDAAMDELAAADVLLYPAFDPGGMVVIEAMARSKAVICLDIGGPAEAVDAESGFLIVVASADEMAGQIAASLTTLDDDRTLLRSMGARGRSIVEDSYQWSSKAATLARVFEKAVSEQAPQ